MNVVIFLLLLFSTILSLSDLISGLEGYFPLRNGVVEDWSGNNVATSVVQGVNPTNDMNGRENRGLNFSKSELSYIEMSSPSDFDFNGAFSISAWVYVKPGIDLLDGLRRVIVCKWNGDSYCLEIGPDGKFRVYVKISIQRTTISPNIVVTGRWYHVAVTLGSSWIRLYVNGEFVAYTDCLTNTITQEPTLPLHIGSNPDGVGIPTDHWEGTIMEVRLYSRWLHYSEIELLYHMDKDDKDDGLEGYYSLSHNAYHDSSHKFVKGTWGVMGHSVIGHNGIADFAHSFNGSCYLDIGPTQGYYPFHEGLSVAAWVKVTENIITEQVIVSKHVSATIKGWRLYVKSPGCFEAEIFVSGGSVKPSGCVGSHSITLNQWYFVAITHKAPDAHIYIDGRLVHSDSHVGELDVDATAKCIIGGEWETINSKIKNGFVGDIQDVMFWSKMISQQEITDIYIGNTEDMGLIGHFPFSGSVEEVTGHYDYAITSIGTVSTNHEDRFGYSSSAAFFSNSYIEMKNIYRFNHAFTVAVFANLRTVPVERMLLCKYSLSNYCTWFGSDNSLKINIRIGAQTFMATTGPIFEANEYFHAAYVFDGNNLRLFYNGEMKKVRFIADTDFNLAYVEQNALIGARPPNLDQMDGVIDDLRIYRRALTPTEIKKLSMDGKCPTDNSKTNWPACNYRGTCMNWHKCLCNTYYFGDKCIEKIGPEASLSKGNNKITINYVTKGDVAELAVSGNSCNNVIENLEVIGDNPTCIFDVGDDGNTTKLIVHLGKTNALITFIENKTIDVISVVDPASFVTLYVTLEKINKTFFEYLLDYYLYFIIGGCVILLIIVFAIIGVVLFCFCVTFIKYQRKFKKYKTELNLLDVENQDPNSSSLKNIKVKKDFFEIKFESVKIIKIIGKGGSGAVVYHGKWEGRPCAFKVFKTSSISGERAFDEFEKEVSMMSSISHPNLLQFYGCSLKPPRVGIVMEYCSKGDLHQYITKLHQISEEISYSEKVGFFVEIASGMNYLHGRGVIHRDLKAKNVLLNDLTQCKIIDFGLSKIISRTEKSLQMTKHVGTSYYMAPEVTLGTKYDNKCDVFSFSIILWEVLNESFSPYGDFKKLNFNVELKVANDPSYRPNVEEGKYDLWIEELMKNCWSDNPNERPSFEEIGKILQENGPDEGDNEVVGAQSRNDTKK